MAKLKVGLVSHFYDKIGVAVIELTAPLAVGDTIEFEKAEFSQTVSSIQIEHEQVNAAKKGQAVGLKVDKPVKAGEVVFKA